MEQIINGKKYFYDNVSLNSFRFPHDPKKLLVKLSLAATQVEILLRSCKIL